MAQKMEKKDILIPTFPVENIYWLLNIDEHMEKWQNTFYLFEPFPIASDMFP